MNLFRHRREGDEADSRAAESFEVVGPDRRIVRYRRDDFAELFETTDEDEVAQQVDRELRRGHHRLL